MIYCGLIYWGIIDDILWFLYIYILVGFSQVFIIGDKFEFLYNKFCYDIFMLNI